MISENELIQALGNEQAFEDKFESFEKLLEATIAFPNYADSLFQFILDHPETLEKIRDDVDTSNDFLQSIKNIAEIYPIYATKIFEYELNNPPMYLFHDIDYLEDAVKTFPVYADKLLQWLISATYRFELVFKTESDLQRAAVIYPKCEIFKKPTIAEALACCKSLIELKNWSSANIKRNARLFGQILRGMKNKGEHEKASQYSDIFFEIAVQSGSPKHLDKDENIGRKMASQIASKHFGRPKK